MAEQKKKPASKSKAKTNVKKRPHVTPAKKKPAAKKTLSQVAKTGDVLATLRQHRDNIAQELDNCKSARDYAALSKQFTEVIGKIVDYEKANPEDEEESKLHELKEKRASDRKPNSKNKNRS